MTSTLLCLATILGREGAAILVLAVPLAIMVSGVLFQIAWTAYFRYQRYRDSKVFDDRPLGLSSTIFRMLFFGRKKRQGFTTKAPRHQDTKERQKTNN
jgi:hypothetical protein